MGEFRMPSLGADMERGTVIEWRVAPGDHVHRGDIVAVVDTDKSDIEVEIFEDGTIEALLVPVGEEVEVGAVLASITSSGDAAPVPTAEPALVPAVVPVTVPRHAPVAAPHGGPVVLSPLVRHRAEQLGVAVAAVHGSGPGGLVTRDDVELVGARRGTGTRLRASPLARRRAMAEGVDLAALEGSGPDGAIVAADVVRTAVRPKRDVDAQAAVGALMARSKREIPHYYLTVHVDLSATLAWLEDRNRTAGVDDRILPAALLLRATALAAMEVPEVNGWWRDGGFDAAPHVDLGVAVARRGGGLVAPVIVGADRLALPALMHAFSDLVARAKSGRLRASEMGDPSITVTSLGDAGADAVVPVIYPPQVAMVGIGRIAERPWAEGGMVGARRTVFLSLAGDHRVTSGHQGSRFLRTLERLLHEPEVL